MKDDLFPYYERELAYFREMSKEFARDYPKVADRLALGGERSSDPHVERLVQAFALIAGRIRHKLDDEFPEITEALLGVLYPHYVRPIPSMAIAQFELDPMQGKASIGSTVARGSAIHTRAIAGSGVSCKFRTCYPVTLLPLRISGAQVVPAAVLQSATQTTSAAAAIRLSLQCTGSTTPASMKLSQLRFYLHGEGNLPYTLYELILNNAYEVLISPAGMDTTAAPHRLPRSAIRAVGFESAEGMLEYPDSSFMGYRLLSEYFSFPEKYLFFELTGLGQLSWADFGGAFEISFLLGEFERKERLRNLERAVKPDTFQLGCTPIINLFQKPAEPIRVSHQQVEYRVVPDQHSRLAMEVYSVDKVTSIASYMEEPREYLPFYGLRHNYDRVVPEAFWYASRRRSLVKNDAGTEVYLSLVDCAFKPTNAVTEALSATVTCTNRDLPAKLPSTREYGDLLIEAGAGVRARSLTKPTESLRPALRTGLQWRLISHLALNHLSLVEHGAEALREVLKLYDFGDRPVTRNQISGLLGLTSSAHVSRISTPAGIAFALGKRVQCEFDEDCYIESGVFLMASIIERFLALYSAVNSFTQFTARTRQRKEVLRTWPPRAGEQILA